MGHKFHRKKNMRVRGDDFFYLNQCVIDGLALITPLFIGPEADFAATAAGVSPFII